MNNLEPDYLNRLFKNAVLLGADNKEAQQAVTDFIRIKMKELSFQRKIMRPRLISKEECYVRTGSDTFYKVVAKDVKDAKAYPISFVGEAGDHYVTEDRYEVDFYRIKSDRWSKSLDELDVYAALGIPITKLIEDNLVFSLHKVEDTRFKAASDKIITDTPAQSVAAAGATLAKGDFINLFKLLFSNQLRVGSILMAENTLLDVWTWDETTLGSNLAGEIILDGYKYDKLLKYPLITTIKNDIIPDASDDAEVWAFAPVRAQEADSPSEADQQTVETGDNYLGVAYTLKEEQMLIDTREDELHMTAKEILGEGFGNTKGVCKLYKS